MCKFTVVGVGAVAFAVFLRLKYLHPFPYCPNDTPYGGPSVFDALKGPEQLIEFWNDYCLECPRHGRCSQGELLCQDGFVSKRNWGFGESCVPDKKQLELIDKIGRRIVDHLSVAAGDAVCRGQDPEPLTEADLLTLLRPEFGHVSKFDNFFRSAVDDLLREAGRELRISVRGDARVFESLRPRLQLSCRLRLIALAFFQRHKWRIISFAGTLLLTLAFCLKYTWSLREREQVAELTQSVLQLLREQASAHKRDPLTSASLFVDQLRDALFPPLTSKARARRLWPEVAQAVTANANVREQTLQSRGEYLTAWEWIGIVGGASGHSPGHSHDPGSGSSRQYPQFTAYSQQQQGHGQIHNRSLYPSSYKFQ